MRLRERDDVSSGTASEPFEHQPVLVKTVRAVFSTSTELLRRERRIITQFGKSAAVMGVDPIF
jgi:hypothetical protein